MKIFRIIILIVLVGVIVMLSLVQCGVFNKSQMRAYAENGEYDTTLDEYLHRIIGYSSDTEESLTEIYRINILCSDNSDYGFNGMKGFANIYLNGLLYWLAPEQDGGDFRINFKYQENSSAIISNHYLTELTGELPAPRFDLYDINNSNWQNPIDFINYMSDGLTFCYSIEYDGSDTQSALENPNAFLYKIYCTLYDNYQIQFKFEFRTSETTTSYFNIQLNLWFEIYGENLHLETIYNNGTYFQSDNTFVYLDNANTVQTLKFYYNWIKFNSGEGGFDEGYFEGYEIGYNNGKIDGDAEGYSRGYREGFDEGYKNGKTDGYNEAENEGSIPSYAQGLFTSLLGILQIEILPSVSIATIITLIVSLSLISILIKLLKG